jgi:hypothetical protein
MRGTIAIGLGFGACVWMLVGACSTDEETAAGAGTQSGQPTSGQGGFGFGGSTSAQGGTDACAGETHVAEPFPLDMYIMLDASGSMTDKTGTMGQGVEKWDAVTQALSSFFSDSQSEGIGAALQFFPLVDPAAPTSCTTNSQCGQFGPCWLAICNQSGIPCSSSQDCGMGEQCIDIGQCQNHPDTFCLPIGAYCPGMQGQCVPIFQSICLNADSCEPMDYATPAVPMGELSGHAAALDAAIAMRSPEGATPTAAALQGAIDYASSWATQNPTHTVVAVLATDGLPTECDPIDVNGIAQIAADGFSATPSIATFAVGVFSGNDMQAQQTLDQIATAGGTNQAFIVDQGGNVEMAFLDALNAIRGSALACEYQIPQPGPGETINYDQINVEHTPPGATQPTTVYYVGSLEECDPTTGGWYYDIDPDMGVPTKILLCPATCDVFKTGGQVEIRVGCATVIPPAK